MSLKRKEFDAFIKGKIQDLPFPHVPGDWNSIENLLNEADASKGGEDQTFDDFIKSSSEQWHTPYNKDHWNLMAAQLRIIETRRKAVVESKIMEITAILFFAFTLFNAPGLLHRYNDQTDKELIAKKEWQSEQTASFSGLQVSQFQNTSKKEERYSHTLKNYSSNTISIQNKTLPEVIVDSGAGPLAYIRTTIMPLERDLFHLVDFKDERASLMQLNSSKEEILDRSSDIDALTLLPDAEVEPLSELALIFPLKYTQQKVSASYYLSVFASGDVNLINTPFDKFYSFASYKKEALNNTYGLGISGKVGNLEFETGMGYAIRRYQPEIITEAFGQVGNHYFEKSLQKISFDIACLPASLKYHFIDQPSWSAYIMGNVSLNFLMKASYDIKETLVQGRPAPGRYTPNEARLDEKPFTPGLLGGGNLSENYFVTLGFGFGIQKRIFKGTFLYLQPSYNRHIFSGDIGIGPNKDKIHTSSLQAGIRTTLFH